jgi:peptidyl-prolyl cis-trans isomerase C
MVAGFRRCLLTVALMLGDTDAVAENFGLAARINGQDIGAERFQHYFDDFLAERGRNVAAIRNPEALRKLRQEALEALIDEELLGQEAARLGIAAEPAEIDQALERMRANFKTPEAFARRLQQGGFDEAGYRDYLARQLAVKRLVEERIQAGITVSDAEIHRFYRANPKHFAIPEQIRLRHILIAGEGDVGERCRAVLAQARRPGADFAALAQRNSQAENAADGGDVGFVSRSQLPPELQAAAFALKPGQVSEPVATDTGCHLLKLEGRRSGVLPESDAREPVRSHLQAEKAKQRLQEHLKTLRREGTVEVLLRR